MSAPIICTKTYFLQPNRDQYFIIRTRRVRNALKISRNKACLSKQNPYTRCCVIYGKRWNLRGISSVGLYLNLTGTAVTFGANSVELLNRLCSVWQLSCPEHRIRFTLQSFCEGVIFFANIFSVNLKTVGVWREYLLEVRACSTFTNRIWHNLSNIGMHLSL